MSARPGPIRQFFGCKVHGQERRFLFFVLPPILLATLAMLYLVLKEEAVPARPPSPAGDVAAPGRHGPPLEPLELIRSLEAAEAEEASGKNDAEIVLARKEMFEKLTASNPEIDRAWGGLGRCLLVAGQPDAALRALENACRLNVVEFRHFAARAEARRATGDLRGALTDYSDALRLRPGDVGCSNRILLLALEMELPELFEHKLSIINKSHGTKADATWVVGVAAREMCSGDFASGLALLQQAKGLIADPLLAQLFEDPVFSDRRGAEFLEKFRALPDPDDQSVGLQ